MGKGIVFIPDAEDIGVFYSNSNKYFFINVTEWASFVLIDDSELDVEEVEERFLVVLVAFKGGLSPRLQRRARRTNLVKFLDELICVKGLINGGLDVDMDWGEWSKTHRWRRIAG